jgi:hypothetical protein
MGSALLQLFGVAWVMPQKVSELLGSWRGQLGNRMALHLWRMAPLCLMWCLWREWNAQSFDCENGLLDLKKLVLQTLYTWRVACNTSSVSTFSEFLALCSLLSLWVRGSLVYILCTWVVPLYVLNEYTLFIYKKDGT